MRLFLAINLPEEVRHHLRLLQEPLRQAISFPASWTRPEQFHITLKFIGEVEEPFVADLQSALAAEPLPLACSLCATALEIFPPRGPARVLGVKVAADPPEPLQALHQRIESVCASLHIPRENRPFRPHVTLARLRVPRRIPVSTRDQHVHHFPGPSFFLQSIDLMQSVLGPKGSIYTRLAAFGFPEREERS
jgi:2'-5' RNA ligase